MCIHIAAFYGLRRSEIISLKWDAIDFGNKTLPVRNKVIEALNDEGKSELVIEEKLKNQSSRRTLLLIPYVEEMLLEKRKSRSISESCAESPTRQSLTDMFAENQQVNLSILIISLIVLSG